MRIAENCALVFISEEFGIDLGRNLAAAAFRHLGGEHAAQPVAEVALVDRAAGKLMRDLQGRGGVGRAGPETQDGGRGKR